MSDEPKKSSLIPSRFICVGCLAALMFYGVGRSEVVVGVSLFGTVAIIVFLMVKDASRTSEIYQNRKDFRRIHRRALAKKKSIKSVDAQLRKRDFETRLNSFVKSDPSKELPDPDEFVSRMEFWERNGSYERSPTRPVGLLRQLLQRIAKLVGRS